MTLTLKVPIWTCVINRAIGDARREASERGKYLKEGLVGSPGESGDRIDCLVDDEGGMDSREGTEGMEDDFNLWDEDLHLPPWIPSSEELYGALNPNLPALRHDTNPR